MPRPRTETHRNTLLHAFFVATIGMGAGCGSDCVDESYLDVTVSDSLGPILATVDWTDSVGETGTVDCPGACEITPTEPGTVTLTATPLDSAVGAPITDEVAFNQAVVAEGEKECPEPVLTKFDFVF